MSSSPKVLPSFAACNPIFEGLEVSMTSLLHGEQKLTIHKDEHFSMTSLLHGEQKLTIHKDIPSSGKAIARSKITAVEDYSNLDQ